MYKFEHSLWIYLYLYHKDIAHLVLVFNKVYELTPEILKDYLKWCETDEAKPYLKGGEKYREPH